MMPSTHGPARALKKPMEATDDISSRRSQSALDRSKAKLRPKALSSKSRLREVVGCPKPGHDCVKLQSGSRTGHRGPGWFTGSEFRNKTVLGCCGAASYGRALTLANSGKQPATARLSSGAGAFFCTSAMRWALVLSSLDAASMRPSKSQKPS